MWHEVRTQPSVTGAVPSACMIIVKRRINADPLSGYPSYVNVAAAFTYDVEVQTPEGPVDLNEANGNAMAPSVERWPAPWLVEGFATGTPLPGLILDGAVYLMDAEDRWAAPCSFTPGGA